MRACLIVDDSPTVRHALAAAVRATRKVEEVHEAGDPAAAMQSFEVNKPDIVFLDMMLAGDAARDPHGEGAQGLTVLRSMLASRPETHVVVITGLPSSQPDVVDAISLGAVAALRKPVNAEQIKYVLDSIQPDKPGLDYFG